MLKLCRQLGGGGDYLSLFCSILPSCKNIKKCYTSDMKNHNNLRKFGFTLAEVLITLGIIGIVAALTIPFLVGHFQDIVIKAKVKKSYSIVSEALQRAINDYGSVDTWTSGFNSGDEKTLTHITFNKYISKYLEPVKICNWIKREQCISKQYSKRLFESTGGIPDATIPPAETNIYVLKDGITLVIIPHAGDYTQYWCTGQVKDAMSGWDAYMRVCGSFYVDINGPKGPNKDGDDLFRFKIFKDGVRPYGSPLDTVQLESFEKGCIGNEPRAALGTCTAWIMLYDNADYRHCPNKIGHNKQHNCK